MWIFVIYISSLPFLQSANFDHSTVFLSVQSSTKMNVFILDIYVQRFTVRALQYTIFLNTFSHLSSVESQKGVTNTVERYSCWEPEGHYGCTKCMVTVLNGTYHYTTLTPFWFSAEIYFSLHVSFPPPPWKKKEFKIRNRNFVSWEPEGRYCSSKLFRWEPEGGYCCTKSMATAPFWFSTEHLWSAITPFWLSTDDLLFAQPVISLFSCIC